MAVATTTTSTAAAQSDDDYSWDHLPDGAEVDFDETALTNYQPYLVQSEDAKSLTRAMFGYRVRDTTGDLPDAYCYWTRYSMQTPDSGPLASVLGRREGVLAPDAHHEDHEPSYIFVDPNSGEVVDGVVTGYHWYAMDIGPDIDEMWYLERQVSGEQTHANLRVADPHHHYRREQTFEGRQLNLENFVTARPNWIDNGFYRPVNPVAVENPWMLSRHYGDTRLDTWWDPSQPDAELAWIRYLFGVRGAETAGDIRRERRWL